MSMDDLSSALYALELALFGTLPLLVVTLIGLILTWRKLALDTLRRRRVLAEGRARELHRSRRGDR